MNFILNSESDKIKSIVDADSADELENAISKGLDIHEFRMHDGDSIAKHVVGSDRINIRKMLFNRCIALSILDDKNTYELGEWLVKEFELIQYVDMDKIRAYGVHEDLKSILMCIREKISKGGVIDKYLKEMSSQDGEDELIRIFRETHDVKVIDFKLHSPFHMPALRKELISYVTQLPPEESVDFIRSLLRSQTDHTVESELNAVNMLLAPSSPAHTASILDIWKRHTMQSMREFLSSARILEDLNIDSSQYSGFIVEVVTSAFKNDLYKLIHQNEKHIPADFRNTVREVIAGSVQCAMSLKNWRDVMDTFRSLAKHQRSSVYSYRSSTVDSRYMLYMFHDLLAQELDSLLSPRKRFSTNKLICFLDKNLGDMSVKRVVDGYVKSGITMDGLVNRLQSISLSGKSEYTSSGSRIREVLVNAQSIIKSNTYIVLGDQDEEPTLSL